MPDICSINLGDNIKTVNTILEMDERHLRFLSTETGQVEYVFWESGEEQRAAFWKWEEGAA